MENFAKSILNYFAAYTETRFRFDKKIDYFWTDNEFTCDLLIFPVFQKNLLEYIQKGTSLDFTIHKGEYIIELDESTFKDELIKNLNSPYNLEYLKSCIKQEIDNYHKKHGNDIIFIADKENQDNSLKLDQNQSNTQTNSPTNQAPKEQQKKLFLEGIRKFNNAYSDGVIKVLTSLQEDKLDKLKISLNAKNIPSSKFNPQQIREKIFNGLQKIAISSENTSEEKYFESIKKFIKAEQFNLILFDLYFLLRQYRKYLSFGNSYLFFHEICVKDNENIAKTHPTQVRNNYKKNEAKTNTKYPIFLVEINIVEKDDEVTIQSIRDIVIINTPAINSLDFQNIITTPRAARFSDAFTYLNQAEKHIQDIYNFYEPFIFTQNYPTLLNEKYPEINFRLGLQIVQKENRKLLDYSELITHIDAGKGGKFIDMVRDYVSGNVTNTTDDVDRNYKERYPRKSVHNIISTIPLTLNSSQKRILTAIENSKNKIVVVDGPPGTGKSYTICAITYWANQKNKSVVITSHKKAALDVIDQMMTDQFKKLHPETKPSIIRLSQDQSSINRYGSTLATPYISSATQRSNTYQDEADAVKKDQDTYFKEIEKQNDLFWNSSDEYQNYIKNLYNLERIREKLISQGVIQKDENLRKIPKDEELDLEPIKILAEKLNILDIDNTSASVLKEVYQQKNRIKEWLAICQDISDFSIKEEVFNKIIEFNIEDLKSFQNKFQEISVNLKPASSIFTEDQKLIFKSIIRQLQLKNNQEFKQKVKELQTHLEHDSIIINMLILSAKNKDELLVSEIEKSIKSLFQIYQFKQNKNTIIPLLELLNKSIDEISIVFDLLRKLQRLFEDTKIVSSNTFQSLFILEKHFSALLKNIDIDFENIVTLNRLFSETDDLAKQIREYISYFSELSKIDINKLPDKEIISEYNHSLYKELFSKNDERTKNLNNYTSSIERIKNSLEYHKRLTLDESKILLENISCIIAEPDMISQYFPMQEDLIDLLIIDEASQVSIAESISLMLRAKQVIVLGDEYQYGAVAAVNVNSSYSRQYFNDILTNYGQDYNVQLTEQEKEALSAEVSQEEDPEEQETQPVYQPEEGKKEWLKTFSIRTSTLNFAKALKNYSTSLNVHFRSFPEIIEYSNEFFYRRNQIPLIINRIRTKPIKQVLRFIPVETKGMSGKNINLDEIEAIRDDLEKLIQNGFQGTIGIITTFREQEARMEEVLRKELKNYHNLEKENRLTIWFVGDVQGEERDIIYYSLVQSKDDELSDLRTIFPVIGGTADKTTSLKMQRLNVGFSRPKDTLVIVHSMPLKEYSNTRLGDALKLYHNLREKAIDNYIEDESIFESPAERNLYNLLTQTQFYQENSDKLKLIAQFPIGEYLSNEYKRYVPKYRVDFLLIFSENGKEKSLILEYDGVEFHTKNPDIVTKHNFSQQYLEYDLERQLELESYGYHFLRINKFSLIPENEDDTEIDVLNSLITKKFESERW